MTTALQGGEWSAARPGYTLPPGKTRYPFYRRLGGPQGRSGRAENLVPTVIQSRTIQPIVSRYTDWATQPTHTHTHIYVNIYIYIYIYQLKQSAYPSMHVICLHNGIVLFFASQPSSDWVNLSLLQGPLLYNWDALLQLCQVVSILKQCSVLAAQVIKTLIIWDILLCRVAHRNNESGGPCCFYPHFSQKDYLELPWRKGWQAHPKCWFLYINIHGIVSKNLLTSLSFISFKRSSYVSYPGLTLWYLLDVIKTHSLYMSFTVSTILMYKI